MGARKESKAPEVRSHLQMVADLIEQKPELAKRLRATVRMLERAALFNEGLYVTF